MNSGPSGAKPTLSTPMLTTQALVNVQLNTGLSNNGLKKLVRTVNQTSDAKMVEPNFYMNFQKAGRELQDFFTCTALKIQDGKADSGTVRVVAHCKDLPSLVNHVLKARKVSGGYFVKLGIDGGRGSLKFCFNIVETPARNEASLLAQKQLLTERTGKNTGVKRQILVAVSEDLPETHDKIEKVWSMINAGGLQLLLACDMKVANIVCGLQTHSSMHPCAFCDIDSKSLVHTGNLRTLGSIKLNLQSFERSGGVVANAKSFGNVIRKPIISGPDTSLILEIIPPMELHLLLGIVNYLFKMLKTAWSDADKWPAALHIQPSPYHGGQFEGNECRKLLKNVDVLHQLAETNSVHQTFSIIEAFKCFNLVVEACFGFILQPDFDEKIEAFKRSYLMIPGASVTPKVHMVFHHITDFISRKGSPLGPYSEQSVETAHQDFHQHWSRYKRDKNHPEYKEKLLNCLIDLNSKHL